MKAIIHNSRFILDSNTIGSKSLTHRYIIGAFLANANITINNICLSNDIKDTISVLETLGAKISFIDENSIIVSRQEINNMEEAHFYIKDSASTLRFLLPLALKYAKKVIFHCSNQLANRPLKTYIDLLKDVNAFIKVDGNDIIASGSFNNEYYEIDTSISSQFVTGLIINAINNKIATTIKLKGLIESYSYIKMSIDVFNSLGFNISFQDDTIIVHNIINPTWNDITINDDYGLSSAFIALSALQGQYHNVRLLEDVIQPDYEIISILKKMGASIKFNDGLLVTNESLLTKGIAKKLNNIDVDIKECIDLFPLLAVIAIFSKGKMTISSINRLVYKESNRLDNIISILKIIGANYELKDNSITIYSKDNIRGNYEFDSYNDHRIVFALTVFGLLNNGTVTINNIEAINKSFPEFYKILQKGIKENAIIIE